MYGVGALAIGSLVLYLRSGRPQQQQPIESPLIRCSLRSTTTVTFNLSSQARITTSAMPRSQVLKVRLQSQQLRTNPSKSPKQSKSTSQTLPVCFSSADC